MQVIIKNLPSEVWPEVLWDCIEPHVVRRNFFGPNDNLNSIKMVKRVFRDNSRPEHHAIVSVSSEQAAQRLISSVTKLKQNQTLKLLSFENELANLAISEFVTRSHGRDRRSSADTVLHHSELRAKDRRRLDSKLIPEAETNQADKSQLRNALPRKHSFLL